MNNSTVNVQGYTITEEPITKDEPLPPELQPIIDRLYYDAADKRKVKIVGELKSLCGKYPDVPAIHNYLSVAYTIRGSIAKAKELNETISAKFPDYLFGKLNMAADAWNSEQYHLMPLAMGAAMKLKDLYPHRTTFHIAEVANYYQLAVRYFVATKNLPEAEERFSILEKLSDDDFDFTEPVLHSIGMLRLQNLSTSMGREKTERPEKTLEEILPVQITEPPVFIHAEISSLYYTNLPGAPEVIEPLLRLPRHTLIKDLTTILKDTAQRFRFFENKFDDGDDNVCDVALHALMMLGELEAEEALPDVLAWLSMNEEFLEFWLGDHITETISEPLYKIGRRQFPLLEEFLIDPDNYIFSKVAVSNVIIQAVLHNPACRPEAIDLYSRYFSVYKDTEPVDVPDFLSMVIGDVIEIRAKELLPQILPFFEKKAVDLFSTGPLKVLKSDMQETDMREPKPVLSLAERYREITSTWHAYNSDDQEDSDEDFVSNDDDNDWMLPESVTTVPVRKQPKIGRNDPCPCGSGKNIRSAVLPMNDNVQVKRVSPENASYHHWHNAFTFVT